MRVHDGHDANLVPDDPIGDPKRRHDDLPPIRIAEVLKDEGFIKDYVLHRDEARQGGITIFLKYGVDREPAISDIKRVSRPGLRRYVATGHIPRVLNGLGIAILSTSKGVMVDREARKQKVGGELICTVW